MDWNRPLTVRSFIIIFWCPVMLVALAWLVYARFATESRPQTVRRVTGADIANEQRELHDNIRGVKQLQNRTMPPQNMDHEQTPAR